MSRWQSEFEQHPFQANWKALVAEVPTLTIDDETVLTSVEEIARFKRAIAYIQAAIDSMDLELVPKSIWDSFHQQCSLCLDQMRIYASTRSLAYLQNANQHVDNLLSYVRPYLILPEQATVVLASATNSYRASLEEYIEAFLVKSSSNAGEIKQHRDSSVEILASMEANAERVDGLVKILIDGTPAQESVQKILANLKQSIDQQSSEIDKLFNRLLVDNDASDSVSSQIDSAQTEINAVRDQVTKLVTTAQQKIAALNAFHQKIYGGTVDDDGKPEEGLEQELNRRTEQLGKLESEQVIKYNTLLAKIESLLPGATSAGLARAYQELRRSFGKPIRSNTRLFYWSVGLMPAVAFLSSIHSFQLSPLSIEFIDYSNVEAIMKAMFVKLPFIAPLVWLALFASTRRSQYERLQQEYAHKEAIAKSYESYKKQLEALLSTDAEPLQKELIQKAIDAISFNASATLDGKHQEKMPIEHVIELLSSEKGQGILERLRKLLP
jgi:hypothetical protein